MDAIAVISAVIAAASAGASFVLARRSQASTERSHELAQLNRETDSVERIRTWADETVAVLVAMHDACADASASAATGDRSLLTALSTQIERGRWFYPNTTEAYGEQKPSAYRGFRHPILDKLVDAHRIFGGHSGQPTDQTATRIADCWRGFVSDIQLEIDPNRQPDETYAALLKRYEERARD